MTNLKACQVIILGREMSGRVSVCVLSVQRHLILVHFAQYKFEYFVFAMFGGQMQTRAALSERLV